MAARNATSTRTSLGATSLWRQGGTRSSSKRVPVMCRSAVGHSAFVELTRCSSTTPCASSIRNCDQSCRLSRRRDPPYCMPCSVPFLALPCNPMPYIPIPPSGHRQYRREFARRRRGGDLHLCENERACLTSARLQESLYIVSPLRLSVYCGSRRNGHGDRSVKICTCKVNSSCVSRYEWELFGCCNCGGPLAKTTGQKAALYQTTFCSKLGTRVTQAAAECRAVRRPVPIKQCCSQSGRGCAS